MEKGVEREWKSEWKSNGDLSLFYIIMYTHDVRLALMHELSLRYLGRRLRWLVGPTPA